MEDLDKMFPNLKKLKKKKAMEDRIKKYRLKIVDVNRINFLEKLAKRAEGYLTQIRNQNKEIEELKDKIKEKELARRRLAGKLGGIRKGLKRNERFHENDKVRKR